MRDNWREVHPKSIFQAAIAYPLSDQEQAILTHLYQPIIGAQAFSLYLTLLSEVEGSGVSESLFHADLITMMDMSTKQIEAARKKLEGIGLLSTFAKNDSELGVHFLYRLNHPETAERFFKDEVLSLTLLNSVGQRKLDKLFDHFRPKFLNLTGFEEVSVGFKDAYLFKEEQVVSQSKQLSQMEQSFQEPRPAQKLSAVNESFDWSYFVQGIEKLGIKLPENSDGFKEEVFVFHNLFGITELDMIDFCSKSFDYYTSKIDVKDFERTVYRTYDPDKKQKQSDVQQNNEVELSSEDQQTYRYNSLKMNGFSTQDIQMIMDSEKNFPLNYLEALKNERGGYTTPQERSLVKYLVSKSGLPNSVINVLVNYVYNIQKQPTLKADYVNRIANEWAQSGIFSPEKAIEHVREIAKKSKEQSQTRQRYGQNNRPIRQETLPDWVNNPIEEKKLSPERQAELERELQELLNEEGD
ncbi:replication initiation and membrane attachment protein [Enterococcus sp. DIV0212c]|uniref:replication initiation and membrane attachment family protein n=1 Tax=Enterococcus sp. DIV0212c TaxID=2230867 RepID=UPI001A9C12F6|nr:DnaD domain protein [Enterococcus sp. DIV0212c]MBO1352573.1 DnaD domain protein [Enterococcus sp. DIV0212c]